MMSESLRARVEKALDGLIDGADDVDAQLDALDSAAEVLSFRSNVFSFNMSL